MCLYQTDPRWRRQAAVDKRPHDVVSSELEGLVEACRPAAPAARPIRRRAMGVMCAVYNGVRRLSGRLGTAASGKGAQLRPRAQQ